MYSRPNVSTSSLNNPSQSSAQSKGKPKRQRNQLSCAECRRLKLRCDRVFPCESCTKRGCAAICPDGSLATKGTRFVLANTEEFHTKISDMSERIRQLESALSTMHPDIPHPLLRQDLLLIKVPVELDNKVDPTTLPEDSPMEIKPKVESPPTEDVSLPPLPVRLNSIGTLRIGQAGRSMFYGPTAWPEFFSKDSLQDVNGEYGYEPEPLPTFLQHIAHAFPHGSQIRDIKMAEQVIDYLPPQIELDYLIDTYYTNAAWFYEPCSRELFTPIYKHVLEYVHRPAEMDMHRLALVYAILAHGSLMDLKQKAYNASSFKYHQLARASLELTPFVEEPSTHTVQTLFLLGLYWTLSDKKDGGNCGWLTVSLCAKLAQALGLHRDLENWDLRDKEQTDARRRVMWELVTLEGWMSLGLGRPAVIKLSEVHCKMPIATQRAMRKQKPHVWYTWKHGLSFYVSRLLERTSSVKTPPYLDILDLDRDIQGFKLPTDIQSQMEGVMPPPSTEENAPGIELQRAVGIQAFSAALLLLHRGFFGKALETEDVAKSQFSPSVLATFNCAWRIVDALKILYSQHPELAKRFGLFWSNAFSAYISFCLFVTRASYSPYAKHAFEMVNLVHELFTSASPGCFPAARVLPILTRLREKVHAAYVPLRDPSSGYIRETGANDEDDDEELRALGGKTNIAHLSVPVTALPKSKLQLPPSLDSYPKSPVPELPRDHLEHAHPLLLEYMAQSKRVSMKYDETGMSTEYSKDAPSHPQVYIPTTYDDHSQSHSPEEPYHPSRDTSQGYVYSTPWDASQGTNQAWTSSSSYAGYSGYEAEQYQYQQHPHYSTNPSLQSYSAADGNQYGAWKSHMEQLGLPF